VEQIKASTNAHTVGSTLFTDAQKLKDQHRAKTRDPQGTGTKKSTAGADGLIDSDSEDEKVVQASKRKAGPEIHTTKPPSTGASMPKAAPPPSKKVKSAASVILDHKQAGGRADEQYQVPGRRHLRWERFRLRPRAMTLVRPKTTQMMTT